MSSILQAIKKAEAEKTRGLSAGETLDEIIDEGLLHRERNGRAGSDGLFSSPRVMIGGAFLLGCLMAIGGIGLLRMSRPSIPERLQELQQATVMAPGSSVVVAPQGQPPTPVSAGSPKAGMVSSASPNTTNTTPMAQAPRVSPVPSGPNTPVSAGGLPSVSGISPLASAQPALPAPPAPASSGSALTSLPFQSSAPGVEPVRSAGTEPLPAPDSTSSPGAVSSTGNEVYVRTPIQPVPASVDTGQPASSSPRSAPPASENAAADAPEMSVENFEWFPQLTAEERERYGIPEIKHYIYSPRYRNRRPAAFVNNTTVYVGSYLPNTNARIIAAGASGLGIEIDGKRYFLKP